MDDAQPDAVGEGDERLLPVLRLQVVRGIHEEGKYITITALKGKGTKQSQVVRISIPGKANEGLF